MNRTLEISKHLLRHFTSSLLENKDFMLYYQGKPSEIEKEVSAKGSKFNTELVADPKKLIELIDEIVSKISNELNPYELSKRFKRVINIDHAQTQLSVTVSVLKREDPKDKDEEDEKSAKLDLMLDFHVDGDNLLPNGIGTDYLISLDSLQLEDREITTEARGEGDLVKVIKLDKMPKTYQMDCSSFHK